MIFPGSCLSMWRKKEDWFSLDQVQMHTVPSTQGFAFVNVVSVFAIWTYGALNSSSKLKEKIGADGGKPGLASCGLQTVLSSACEGQRRRRIDQDGLALN